MTCPWRQCVSHFQEIDWIAPADKKLIMGEGILRLARLEEVTRALSVLAAPILVGC